MTATALEREFNQLQAEKNRIGNAISTLRVAEAWIEHVDANIHQVTSVYSSRYSPQINICLEPMLVDSFNDGKLAETLDSLCAALQIAVEVVTAKDEPEARCRSFVMKVQRGGISIEYTLRVYLRDDSTCQIVIDGYDEVQTSKYVDITERRPRMRFVCPED